MSDATCGAGESPFEIFTAVSNVQVWFVVAVAFAFLPGK